MPRKAQTQLEWLSDEAIVKWFSKIPSERTKKNYREQFPKWLAFVSENTEYKSPSEIIESRRQQRKSDDSAIEHFWEDKFIEFKHTLEGKSIKIPTVRSYLRTVASFFAHNREPLSLERGDWKIQPSEKDKVRKEWIPDREEIKILYRTCESARDRGILLVLYGSGFSEVDAASMKIQDFDFYDSNGMWKIKSDEDLYHERLREKTGETQQTCISREALEDIRIMLQSRGFPKEGVLFVSFRGEPLEVRGINEAMKSVVKKAFDGRVKEWQTKHLRDAYMNALSQAQIQQKIADLMSGHKPEGARADYRATPQTIRMMYAQAFPYLTVNGFGSQQRRLEEIENKMNEDKLALTELLTQQQQTIKELRDNLAHLDDALAHHRNKEIREIYDDIKQDLGLKIQQNTEAIMKIMRFLKLDSESEQPIA